MAQTEIPSYKRMDTAAEPAKKKQTATLRLKKRDYIAGGLSFLLARASMFGAMSPFATAFFASSFTKGRMPLTMLCTLVGCLSAGMGTTAFKYLIAMGFLPGISSCLTKRGRMRRW